MSKLSTDQRKEIIANLKSCGCKGNDIPWQGKDDNILNSMSDDGLIAFDECRKVLARNQQQQVNNSNTSFLDEKGNRYIVNAETGLLSLAQPAQTNNVITPNTPPVVPAPDKGPKTMMEFLNNGASEEDKTVWNAVMSAHNEQKAGIIARLVENKTGPERDAAIQLLGGKQLPELSMLASLLPAKQEPAKMQQPTQNNWLGAIGSLPQSGGVVTNEEPLVSPNYEWDKPVANLGRTQQMAQA